MRVWTWRSGVGFQAGGAPDRNAYMHKQLLTTLAAAVLAVPVPALAQQPEIERAAGTPQAVGAVHTLRTITEACTRLEGVFTADAEPPYAIRAVQSTPGCQPRARFDREAEPEVGEGWILNDRITVPSAACAGHAAVVEVWRLPGTAAPPELDAQGKARIYFKEGQQAQRPDTSRLQRYATTLRTEGTCRAQ